MDNFAAVLKTVKLITSSLFARKQPYMIINGHTPDTFYFTNIEHERVALYRATMEDVLSRVTITDSTVTGALYEAFPALKNVICELHITKFSSYLGKAVKVLKDKFPEIKVDTETNLITMKVPVDGTNFQDLQVGILLSENDPEFYYDIIRNYDKFADKVEKRRFHAIESIDSDKVSIEIVELVGHGSSEKAEFGYPIKDGFNLVSAKEYVKKRKLDPIYDLILSVNSDSMTSKATIHYVDDWLDAMTIMPGSLWFMSRLAI